jgi:hypothetical protein
MGKFYGNAYFGHYNEETDRPVTVNELVILKDVLDEFNALGYHISNLHRLSCIEDKRFVPLIVDNVNKYGLDGPMWELVYALNRLSYHEATPDVLKWHQDPQFQDIPESVSGRNDPNWMHWHVSNAALAIRNKKYMPLYMDIIRQRDYGRILDLIIDIPLIYKNREALDLLLRMQEENGIWGWWVAKYVPRFKDPSLIPELERLLDSQNSEIRAAARKGVETLKALV